MGDGEGRSSGARRRAGRRRTPAAAGGATRRRLSTRTLIIIVSAAVIGLVVLVVQQYAFGLYRLPSEAMVPTLQPGDRVLINRLDTEPALGDLVVFQLEGERPMLLRVMGLEGQTVAASEGVLTIDGQLVVEPYLDPDIEIEDFGPVEVPTGSIFTLGDNRATALDARILGPVPASDIVGTVVRTIG